MVTATHPQAWSEAIARPATEFALTPLKVISGSIPEGLQGTLYRNGPARLSRGGDRVGHWFDGDGAVLAVHFEAAEASAVYRYVKTEGYLNEERQDSFIYPNYGMTAPGAFWNNWLKPVKNAANTSVLALPDKVLALWEGGLPHALNLEDLTTQGKDKLSGLSDKQSYSAHPKVDSQTEEIFNFGIGAGLNATLNLYRSDRTGKIQQQSTFDLKGLPLVHDFLLAGQYLVFFVSPVRVNLAAVTLGRNSFSDAMEWQPELGTEVLVFDRQTLSLVSRSEAEPWYQWHFTNGCVDNEGAIVTELVRYEDFQTNQYLQEVATGSTKTSAPGTLWQVKINPQTGEVVQNEQLLTDNCEFPVIDRNCVGKSWRYTYLTIQRDRDLVGKELFGAIARFDRETGNLSIADMGENCYASEPIYVSQPNSQSGWLLTVVYNGNEDSSEVRIYQSDRLTEEPCCRLALPSVIPHSFHGTWKDK
ncbi:carotenoid oxygenase family protein [Myxosarcina sp. GI1]|uniref:carotenoid oxygenase family protein n=1 Tax=Myxosarcina sp. GI1 TaxID=1541065 RepID=UPI00055EE49B|nr:carotenoid oxygenase family protein [Myxosarcina sp. GI1]